MSDEPVGQVPASANDGPDDGLEALTDEILPALIARLRASRLGELEVRTDGWRVRLRRDGRSRSPGAATRADGGEGAPVVESLGSVAISPAVGYFDPGRDLAVGQSVQAGDLLGTIDVLGVVRDVVAPSDGIISGVLVDEGQAVEYGQALAEIDPLELITDEDAGDEEAVE